MPESIPYKHIPLPEDDQFRRAKEFYELCSHISYSPPEAGSLRWNKSHLANLLKDRT